MLFRLRYSLLETHITSPGYADLVVGDVSLTVQETTHPNAPDQVVILASASLTGEPSDAVAADLGAWAASDMQPINDRPLANETKAYVATVSRRLIEGLKQGVELLRWCQNARMPHSGYSHIDAHWSEDEGLTWQVTPVEFGGYAQIIEGLRLSPVHLSLPKRLAARGETEPTAHNLLREAYDVAPRNPRSALVIAIAALETGFKALVSELVPHAAWLATEAPTPPLRKMLTDYLPSLPVRRDIEGRGVLPPPQYVRKRIHDVVEARNRLAHRGASSPLRGKELDNCLDEFRDLLYLFDYYRGHEWALQHISPQFRAALGT